MTKEEIIKSLKKRYSEYKKSCVKLNISDLTTNSINSYWGGKPLVDNDFIWPFYKRKVKYGNRIFGVGSPLTFLLQIDCSKLVDIDKENLLPSKGILSFFYCTRGINDGSDKKEKGFFAVKYFPNIDELHEFNGTITAPDSFGLLAKTSADKPIIFPKYDIALEQKDSFPGMDEMPAGADIEEYLELYSDDVDGEYHTMLSYQNNIQNDMKPQLEEMFPTSSVKNNEWILLLQIESFERKDFNFNLVDDGRLYFWIRKKDLLDLKFDKTWAFLQFD